MRPDLEEVMMLVTRRAALAAFLALGLASLQGAHAQGLPAPDAPAEDTRRLPPPTGPVILEITGDITRTTDGDRALFDLRALKALPRHRIITATAAGEQTRQYEGPLAREVLALAGAKGRLAEATALDGYVSEIPVEELERYDVILADMVDGQPLPPDRGPLWIIYPRNDHPELMDEDLDTRLVWQVNKLDMR